MHIYTKYGKVKIKYKQVIYAVLQHYTTPVYYNRRITDKYKLANKRYVNKELRWALENDRAVDTSITGA